MRTKVYAYRGIIGVESDPKAEGLLNDPTKPGQLGYVVDAKFVDVSKQALALLKTIPKSRDDIGDMDVYAADSGMVVFCWLGGSRVMLNPASGISGSSTYDPSLLKATTTKVKIDPNFLTAVDRMLGSKAEDR